MKKIFCLVVLTAASVTYTAHTMTSPASDMNKAVSPYFEANTPVAMPNQHKTMLTMCSLDEKCMTHPDIAKQHIQLLNQAYVEGHINGQTIGIKQAGQCMQSCLNGMANTMNTKTK